LVDMNWLREVVYRAVRNTKNRSTYAFASARVVGKRKYRNRSQSSELDAAQIVKAYVELHGPDLETYRRVYSDPANRKGMLYSLAREAPPGFGRPFFSHESEV